MYKNVSAEIAAQFADNFVDGLLDKPFASNGFDQYGLFPYNKIEAIQQKHIQVNSKGLVKHLLFDLDHDNIFVWSDVGFPEPSWQAINPLNGHSHIAYTLKVPVCVTEKGHKKPKIFLEDVQLKMLAGLNADLNYAGLTTKNPLHEYWNVLIGTRHDYELGELAEYCYKFKKAIKHKREEIFGSRNCSLFNSVRIWAYRNVSRSSDLWIFREAVLNELMMCNTCKPPLPYNEARSVAKSIANWTWAKFERNNKRLRERQSNKGIRSGEVRSKHIHHSGSMGYLLTNLGVYTQSEAAEILWTTDRTLRNWIAAYKK